MHTTCPYCGQKSKKLFTARDLNQNLSNLDFTYYRCESCNLIFLSPIPENLHEYYGQEYPAYQKMVNIKDPVLNYDVNKVAIVKKYSLGNKILEIGSGNGAFAYLAMQEGFIVDAIEMDPTCCKFLKDELKVRHVINCNNIVQALDQTQDKYDAIVMWHVLEHLINPLDALRTLPNKLSQDGIIIIAVPNPEAFQFKLFKQYWKHVDAPRHVVFMPLKSILKEMAEIGMKTLLATTNDRVSAEFNSYDWWLHSLRNFISGSNNNFLNRILQKHCIAKTLYNQFIRRIEQTDGGGNAYLAIFKKD